MVPERLSEKEFWERYFKYEVARKVYFSSNRDGVISASCSAMFPTCPITFVEWLMVYWFDSFDLSGHQAKRQGRGAGDDLEDPYKEFMDEELDFREAQKRLQFVNATVNLAADAFDRVRIDHCPLPVDHDYAASPSCGNVISLWNSDARGCRI